MENLLFFGVPKLKHNTVVNNNDAPAEEEQKPEALAQGYKTLFMLNSVKHEFFPAHKC